MLKKTTRTSLLVSTLWLSGLSTTPNSWAITTSSHTDLIDGKHLHLQQRDLSEPQNRTFYEITQEKKQEGKPLVIAQVATTNDQGEKIFFHYEATRFHTILFGKKNTHEIAEMFSEQVYDPISGNKIYTISFFGLPISPKKDETIFAEQISSINFDTVQSLLSSHANQKTKIIESLIIVPSDQANYMAGAINTNSRL